MPRESAYVRDPERRQRILAAAGDLIAQSGYLGVSMADIGTAAGIVGSGIYRHFDSKAAILVELFDQVVDRLVADAEVLLHERSTPEETLAALVRGQVRFAMDERTLCEIYVRESRHLPDNDQRRLRWKQRHYVDLWQDLLRSVHPDLTAPETAVLVHAAIAAGQAVLRFRSPLDEQELARLLTEAACRALRIDPSAGITRPTVVVDTA
ncbi:TetR/AcrR family transcriptional regulator [Pseudonocardia sp. GCM10023141]|uniref:TetR/AcrR family transcriptional regulator n=1 Tax=Pseudonocardia sp. GCM10023141 TaxID=3252653 RepID=UPI003622A1A2